MKKYVISFIVFCCCFTLVGCGKKSVITQTKCSKVETDEVGNQTNTSMLVFSKNGKVTKVDSTVISEMDSEMIDFSLSFGNSFVESLKGIKGIQASYEKITENKIQFQMIVDFENLDSEALKTSLSESGDEDSYYFNKDISFDEFKESNLAGFVCE